MATLTTKDSFTQNLAKMENSVTSMTKLMIILEKKGEERSFDELLIVRTGAREIPCLRAALANLRPDQVDELCRSMMLETFSAGSVVFKQGDVGDKFYVILNGSCDIKIKLAADLGGEEVVAVTYHSGQQFGERALDYNEPRAATVQAAVDTALIAFSTHSYKRILRSDGGGGGSSYSGNDASSKTKITNIMSKNRSMRGRDELATVVSYICPRVQFLQKFTYDQQIELFRVCDFVTLWGKTTLFKQGTTGEAFYIVVSGHVDVFVNKLDAAGVMVDIEVATIQAGSSFGEVALEREDSKRTATCVTCESCTELLVIGKEEYNKLIVMVQQKDFSEKVSLLRRTHPFQAMDLATLAEVGKLMEFRSWRVNSIVYVAGEVASSFFVLSTGEFGIKSEVFLKDGSSQVMDFGRVGPAAVMGEYSFQCELFSDEVLCKETVTATTNCTGYVVSKYDMFNRLPRDHHQYILESLKKLEAPKSYLWDTTPHPMTEEDWKIQSVWTSYRKDVLKSFYHPLTNRTPSILAKSKLIEKKIYVPTNHKPAEDTTEFDNVSTTSSISVEDKAEELTSMAVGIPSPNAKGRKDFNRKMKDQTKISRPSSAINEIRVHDEEWDKFEIVDQATEIDIHESLSAHNDKQVNFSHKQIGSMSFGDSPPGSPHSNRPDSRGGGSPDSAKGRKDLQPLPLQALQEPLKRQHFALPPSMGTMRNFSVQNSKYIDGSAPQGIGTLKSFAASNVFRPPFCLIQLHREKLKMRPIQGSRRLLKCYFRVCGLVGTCNEAKLAAESQMLNISMRFKAAGSDSSGHYSGRTTTLNWNRFSGFATMPLQNTDHFLIYCRGSPIEFASFTPPIGVDLLDAPFPSACKPTGQHFACLSVYRISAPRPSIVLYGEDDLQDLHKNEVDDPLAKPLLMKEMSAIVEAMGTTPSRLDALRYAFSLTEQSELAANAQPELVSAVVKAARWSTTPDPKALASLNTPDGVNAPQRLITVPLYVWLHISEDTFRFYDHADFTTEELSSEDRFISIMRNRIIPRQDMAISVSELNAANIGFKVSSTGGSPNKTKSVSEELKDAIASVGQVLNDGVNKMNTTNESRGCAKEGKRGVPSLHRAASTNVLKNERTNRVLISTVENRLRHLGTEESTFSTDLMSSASGSSLNTSADQPPPKVGFKKTISETSSIEFKIKALKDNIATRQRVLSLSDELCKIETKLKLEQAATKPRAAKLAIEQKSVITYDLDGELAADDNYMQTRMTPADLKVAQKRLVEKRLEIFDALQGVPHNKFYSEAGDLGHKTATIGKLSVALRASDNHRSLHSSVASDQTSKKNGNNVSSLMRKKLNALETVSTTITS